MDVKSAEKDVYVARYLIRNTAKLDAPDLWEKLYSAIDNRGFFSHQARALGGFEQTTEDLEQTLLPRVVEAEEWQRFVHYGQVAAHLRGLAEALGEKAVIEELERVGRSGLAEGLVAQLSDPTQRACLRATLAAALPRSGEAFGNRLKSVKVDLKEASGEGTETWCAALEGVARHLGLDLRARWSEWAERLPEGHHRDRVWRAVVESFLDRGDLEAPTLWRALASIEDLESLLDFLPERLALLAPQHSPTLVNRLREELAHWEASALWRLALPVASTWKTEGREIFRRLASELGSPPWTVELVEAGSALWPRLPKEDVDRLCRSIRDPVAAVALRVVALEGTEEAPKAAVQEAFTAVEAMPAGSEQLHWGLRLLGVRAASSPSSELAGPVAALARHLARLRYAADAEDLLRFLELVAAVFPKDLRRQLEDVLWAPESSASTLRTLAREAAHPHLLKELFERAEEYAALVAATSAEGFELRCEVLVTVSRQLCIWNGDLEPFEKARERLLPEEEDGLRREVAHGLAVVGRRDQAAQLAAGISIGRARLRTLLEVLPPEAEAERRALLTPEALYQAMADSGAVHDELNALAPLLEEPRAPAALARDHLEEVRSPGRRIEGLLDLAHHTLDWQEEHFSRALQDRLAAVLPLKQALGVVESDLWLARLTPELVEVGARLGAKQAVAEVEEAWERVIGAEAVAWKAREEVLVALLGRLERLFPVGAARKRLRDLVEWLARSPAAMADSAGRQELRSHWHRLFPWLAAVEARLPGGSERSWAKRGLAPWRRRWDWLTPEQERVLESCFAPREERRRLAQALEDGEVEEDRDLLWALACRMTADAPEAVPTLVAQLTSRWRDRMGLLLLSGGWLPPEEAERLLPLFSAEGHTRPWGEVWLGLGKRATRNRAAREEWLRAVSRLAAASVFDLSDPRTAPVRRRLWETPGAKALSALALTVPSALATGGKEGGEAALRLFLNAHLAPRGGRRTSRGAAAQRQAMEAELRAARLDGQGAEHPSHNRTPSNRALQPDRLDKVQQRWNQVARRGPRSSPWSGSLRETLANPATMLSLASAFFLIPLDAPFWPHLSAQSPTQIGTANLPALPVHLSLVFLFLAQALLVDRFLAWRFVAEFHVFRGIRCLRFLFAGLPFVGLGTIPAWKALMRATPSWAVAPQESCTCDRVRLASRDGPALPPKRLAGGVPIERALASPWTLAVLFLASFGWMFLLAVPWAVGWALASPGGLGALLLFAIGLHGLAFAGAVLFLALRSRELQLSEHQRAVYLSLSLFWLIPYPVMAFCGLGLWLFFEARVEREPLVTTAWSDEVGRLPVWERLTTGLRSVWQLLPLRRRLRGRSEKLDARPSSGQTDRQVLWFYRGKAFALFVEAAALSWGIQWLAEDTEPPPSQSAEELVGTLALASLILGGVGLAGMGVMLVRRLLRLPVHWAGVDWRRLAGFLAGSQFAFFAGLEVGDGLFRGDADHVAGVLMLLGLGGAVINLGPLLLSMLVSLPEEERERTWWTLFFAALGLTGGTLAQPENAPLLRLLQRFVLMGPGLALVGAAARLDWFVRPAHPRQIPSSKMPIHLRRRLAFLVGTALLPGGGLLVPLWIWLRPRWWPDFDSR